MIAAILAAIIVVILIYGISRYLFGRRLHMAGGRARQPRLGVIDAYDIDRQRQLVLVRRDNVEHLIMIGGPNDLLIESAFVRAQPTMAVPSGRDKEAALAASPAVALPLPSLAPEPAGEDRAAAVQPAAGAPPPALQGPGPALQGPGFDLPQPGPAQPPRAPTPRPPAVELGRPVVPKDLGPLSDLPAPGPAAAPDPAVAAAPPPADPPAPAPQPDAPPAPEQGTPAAVPIRPSRFPVAAVRPAGTPLPPRPPLTALRASIVPSTAATPGSPTPGNGTSGNGTARSTLPGLANRPMPLNPMQRGTSAASLRRDPPLAPPPGDAPPNTAAPAPPMPALATPGGAGPEPSTASLPVAGPPSNDPAITLDSIESLEEEMARLLGRAAGGEKS